MKKVFYISSIVLAFGFVSCDKQEFNPNNEENQDIPAWEKGGSGSNIGNDVIGDDQEDDEIVDPNYDPDGKSKRI